MKYIQTSKCTAAQAVAVENRKCILSLNLHHTTRETFFGEWESTRLIKQYFNFSLSIMISLPVLFNYKILLNQDLIVNCIVSRLPVRIRDRIFLFWILIELYKNCHNVCCLLIKDSTMKALQSLDQLLWATLSCSDRNESDMYDFHQDQDKSPRERQPKISKMVVNHVICNSGSIIGDQKENPECMTLPGIPSHEFDCDPFIRCALNKHITRILTIYLTHHKSLESDVGFRLPDSETELCQESAMELSDLISYVWERLNTGHWKSIPCLWRKLYTCLSIIKVLIMSLWVLAW